MAAPVRLLLPMAEGAVPGGGIAGALGTDAVEAGEMRLYTEAPNWDWTRTNSGLLLIALDSVTVEGRLRLMDGTSQSAASGTAEKGLVWPPASR